METNISNQTKDFNSVGILKPSTLDLLDTTEKIQLDCGRSLSQIKVAYETYGKLNSQGNNAILILHALTGDAHAAGKHAPDDAKPGWWDFMIGPDKPLDTNRYFIVCSNVLGGCKGTTGPDSLNPENNETYGMTFPIITIGDMVRTQKRLLDRLGIKSLLSLVGGSMGGMQALEWLLRYPDFMDSAIIIAATSKLSPQAIAFHEVGRQAIISDPNWQKGDYYNKKERPETGLAIARMLGHITYLSPESMDLKFGRRLQNRKEYSYEFVREFEVENYLHAQGLRFVKRFDANSYLYMTKAMDYYNAEEDWGGSLEKVFSRIKAKTLVISFTSDWLFPPYQSKELVKALRQNNKDVSYVEIESYSGHDAFLIPSQAQAMIKAVDSFLDNLFIFEKKL